MKLQDSQIEMKIEKATEEIDQQIQEIKDTSKKM